jgi:NADH-quinone oxidoreductase subunit H
VFNLAPIMGLVATFTILLYIPIGSIQPVLEGSGDLILILYLLIIPSLAMVIGGFASGSPYATVGAQREMATMIAYEFPLAIIIIGLAWRVSIVGTIEGSVFSLATMIANPLWNIVSIPGFIGLILLLLILMVVTPAELSKIPFDSPEAGTEIAGGLLVEYSGRNLALFYLTDGVKTVVMASLIVALFFPYNIAPLLGLESASIVAYTADFLFYLLKLFIVIFFSVTLIRVGIARLKIDQIVYTYWVWFTLIALLGLVAVMWDQFAITQLDWPSVAKMLGF